MKEVIFSYLKDSDININILQKRLKEIAEIITYNNKMNLTDINIICEEIFCKMLNKVYDLNLQAVSIEKNSNHIAVDLVDSFNRVAYQVTSRTDNTKIKDTITKFNKSYLAENIEQLNFLILNNNKKKYKQKALIQLKNGQMFSYEENIINFNKLIDEIEKKCVYNKNFIEEIYDIISMVYDSGRFKYVNIIKNTEDLKKTDNISINDKRIWIKGYGDVHMNAFIPLSYTGKLSCELEFRQYDISGISMIFNQEEILNDYFVSETEFINKHFIVGYKNEEDIFMQLKNIKIRINAHTAYHIHSLFLELKKEYLYAKKEINYIMGTIGLAETDEKYLLTKININNWNEIKFFAQKHNYLDNNAENDWNIFNDNLDDRLILSANPYNKICGDILCEISAKFISETEVYLLWSPGWKNSLNAMDGFDNVVKWKADFTKEWIETKLIKKAHEYYVTNNKKDNILKRLQNIFKFK